MKKMMIAAAAAAIFSSVNAASSCPGCNEVLKPNTAFVEYDGCVAGHVWDLKFSLKTLGPKTFKSKECDDTCFYLDKATRNLQGVVVTCECPCEEDGESLEFTRWMLWETKNKAYFGDPLTKTYRVDVTTNILGKVTSNVVADINFGFGTENTQFRYGKKAQDVAMGGVVEGDFVGTEDMSSITMHFAGFGKFDVKNMVIKSVAGDCVGWIYPCDCEEAPLALEICYEDFEDWCIDGSAVDSVPFTGSWTMKYNASGSKALHTGKRGLSSFFPKWTIHNSYFAASPL